MMTILIYKYGLSFLWAFIIALFAIPSIINLAYKKRLLDVPNGRNVHQGDIPRLGGLAIFAGFFSSVMIFSDFSTGGGVQYLLAGLILLFFIGLKDDVKPVSAFKKFFVQVLCCCIIMFLGDVRIESFYGLLGVFALDEGLSYLFTFLVLVGLTNSINLIDGVNGLAGTIVVIISVFLGLVLVLYQSPLAIVSFALVGAMIGFLRYNLFSGKIFMGDTGSLVSGFVVSVLAVSTLQIPENEFSPVYVLSVFSLPILDTLRVMIIRTLQGVSPFTPDKRHLHHVLVKSGMSHPRIVTVTILINVVMILSIWLIRDMDIHIQFSVWLAEALLLLAVIWYLDKRYA